MGEGVGGGGSVDVWLVMAVPKLTVYTVMLSQTQTNQ